MNLDSLNKWLILVANLCVVFGVLALVYELQQNSEATRLQSAQAHLNNAYQIDLLLAQDSELTSILFTPESERTVEQQFRYERFANALLRSWQTSYDLYLQGVLDEDVWAGNVENISALINNEPSLRNYRARFSSNYTPRFNTLLDELMATGENQ